MNLGKRQRRRAAASAAAWIDGGTAVRGQQLPPAAAGRGMLAEPVGRSQRPAVASEGEVGARACIWGTHCQESLALLHHLRAKRLDC